MSRNRPLRQPGERWETPVWSSYEPTQYYLEKPPESFHVASANDMVFSTRYNAYYTADQVACTYRRIFIGGGDNIQGGGVYYRTDWNRKAVMDALSGLRGVVSASLYDGMKRNGMTPSQTAISIAREVANCWQPNQADHLMQIIEGEMCDRNLL